jgi:hypothetical protein
MQYLIGCSACFDTSIYFLRTVELFVLISQQLHFFLFLQYEVSTVVKTHVVGFWIVTPSILVGGYQHFGETLL